MSFSMPCSHSANAKLNLSLSIGNGRKCSFSGGDGATIYWLTSCEAISHYGLNNQNSLVVNVTKALKLLSHCIILMYVDLMSV